MSLKNYFRRRVYKERAQPSSRKKFGLLEKHKDYVERAKAYHKKEDTLRRLKEKAANRNPDEFYFDMIKTNRRSKREVNNYTREELSLMKTQDIGYVLQKVQRERKRFEKLNASLHSIDNQRLNKHDRKEAKELQSQHRRNEIPLTSDDIPASIKRKTEQCNKELEARRNRLSQLEKTYRNMNRTSKWK